MPDALNLGLIMAAALVAVASPGPATLAIAGTSMRRGRKAGLLLASGIQLGSLSWSIAAALGLSALMLAHGWVLETIRYAGVLYLFYLAFKAARSAVSSRDIEAKAIAGEARSLILRGAALHITNPKAILFFGALYSLGVPADASPAMLATVVTAVGCQSAAIFFGYALLFSFAPMTRLYIRLRRAFEGAFAVGFAAAGLKIATARLQ